MENDNKPEKKDAKEEIFDQFYDLTSVVSATGMTGSTPELPQSGEELEAYSKLLGTPKSP